MIISKMDIKKESVFRELQTLNARIQEFDTEINRAPAMIDQYENDKGSALTNMAYYKKFMTS